MRIANISCKNMFSNDIMALIVVVIRQRNLNEAIHLKTFPQSNQSTSSGILNWISYFPESLQSLVTRGFGIWMISNHVIFWNVGIVPMAPGAAVVWHPLQSVWVLSELFGQLVENRLVSQITKLRNGVLVLDRPLFMSTRAGHEESRLWLKPNSLAPWICLSEVWKRQCINTNVCRHLTSWRRENSLSNLRAKILKVLMTYYSFSHSTCFRNTV